MTQSDDAVGREPAWAGDLGVLIACYPQFRFCRVRIGQRGPRWIAERIDTLAPGLYTMITADLSELRIVLTDDRARHAR